MNRNFLSRIVIGLLVAMGALSFSLISQAEAPAIDFEQGFELRPVLENVKGNAANAKGLEKLIGPGQVAGLIPMLQPAPLPPELQALKKAMMAGWVFGPWQPKIYQHPSYLKARQYPPKVNQLPPDVSGPLQAEWRERIAEGNGAIETAKQLEPQDQKLYDDGVLLIKEKEWLDSESAEIDAWRARYQNRCWVENPPSDCEDERLRLNARIAAFNARVGVYNSNLSDWRQRRDNIKDSGEKLDARIAAWGEKLDTYSAKAEKALEEAGWTTVVFQAQGDDMPDGGKSTKADLPGPLCLEAGEQRLMDLQLLLTARELRERDQAIVQAATWMRSAAAAGGLRGRQPNKPFYNPNPTPRNARIDIEVFRGWAFVHCPAALELVVSEDEPGTKE
ncbi:MAG: hypothetical protein ABIJ96_17305 [Elusimicrobiota bacterium]